MFTEYSPQEINDGVLWCGECKNWYPIQNGLLDLLTGALVYVEDRKKFWDTYSVQLEKIGLSSNLTVDESKKDLQSIQQTHFDWYASNELQTYNDYEKQPFWLAADRLAFEPWRKEIIPGSWLLDVGCAEGRSTFKLMDMDINVIGFDVSKALVRQAINRYRAGSFKAKATFCVADASNFPFKNSTFNYVLIYGVLHHLPDPIFACREVARVLKLNGKYIGSENNKSAFRIFFDLLQKLNPLWHEEAGPEALISHSLISEAFRGTGVKVETQTSIFLPPHLINLFSQKMADQLLSITDKIGGAIPFIRKNGGLIIINGLKSKGE
jgi:SAM-dependent methyltransferase